MIRWMLGWMLDGSWIDFWWILGPFWEASWHQVAPKSKKRGYQKCDAILDGFWKALGWLLDGFWEPK